MNGNNNKKWKLRIYSTPSHNFTDSSLNLVSQSESLELNMQSYEFVSRLEGMQLSELVVTP